MQPVHAGAAAIDITPPAGLAMAGFAVRRGVAHGAHDRLTARAVVIDDTAVVVADVLGLDVDFCERVRDRVAVPSDNTIVAALHTHGGPAVLPSLNLALDAGYYQRLEDACVTAVDRAAAARRPAKLLFGAGDDPQVARNRRHRDGPVDGAVPVLRILGTDDRWIAAVTAYACHPVVLGADNLLWTADYPATVRQVIEAAHPGAVALFLTGCCGDANHGHSAGASLTTRANSRRTFETAEAIGRKVAETAIAAQANPVGGAIAMVSTTVSLDLQRRETEAPEVLAERWRAAARTASAEESVILNIWASWAETTMTEAEKPIPARVSVVDWGGAVVVAMPGEVFAETAQAVRDRLNGIGTPQPAFVIGYADGCPGYIPPASEFAYGGYEIDEAHRYYNRPATFAPGSAERLVSAAEELASGLKHR